jgi:hypothetical protein
VLVELSCDGFGLCAAATAFVPPPVTDHAMDRHDP